MKLVCNYMKDEELRHKLNSLTRQTFYFDFENWVTGGYFEGDYIPYSFLEEEGLYPMFLQIRCVLCRTDV